MPLLNQDSEVRGLEGYIVEFYNLAIWIGGFLAVIVMMFGGVIWFTAGGSPDKVKKAQEYIFGAISGLILILCSYVILETVNLRLVSLEPLPLEMIKSQSIVELNCAWLPSAECEEPLREEPDLKKCGTQTAEDQGKICCCLPATGQWCQRPAPAGSQAWRFQAGIDQQVGDASPALVAFINCMYSKVPALTVNSISSNDLCQNPYCDTTQEACGHGPNSCHFGGLDCQGMSYAVDFDEQGVICQDVQVAAYECDLTAWFNHEGNHIHISVNGYSCGCNERYDVRRAHGGGGPCP